MYENLTLSFALQFTEHCVQFCSHCLIRDTAFCFAPSKLLNVAAQRPIGQNNIALLSSLRGALLWGIRSAKNGARAQEVSAKTSPN